MKLHLRYHLDCRFDSDHSGECQHIPDPLTLVLRRDILGLRRSSPPSAVHLSRTSSAGFSAAPALCRFVFWFYLRLIGLAILKHFLRGLSTDFVKKFFSLPYRKKILRKNSSLFSAKSRHFPYFTIQKKECLSRQRWWCFSLWQTRCKINHCIPAQAG